MVDLLIALLVVVIAGLLLVAALFFLRHYRKAQKAQGNDELPMYNEKKPSNHRRLTITTSPGKRGDSIYVYDEKRNLMETSCSTPTSPIPEIRITFPEEVDETGKKQSGRVVVVRVGDHSVGLEPLQEELPPYQKDPSDRFQSLDLDRIGGLKEKDQRWS